MELRTICVKSLEFCLKVIALGDHAKTTKIQNMLPVFTNGLMAHLFEFCENNQHESWTNPGLRRCAHFNWSGCLRPRVDSFLFARVRTRIEQ